MRCPYDGRPLCKPFPTRRSMPLRTDFDLRCESSVGSARSTLAVGAD